MKAKAGDVYCVYNTYLNKYTACQITKIKEDGKDQKAVLLSLDWSGEELLKKEDLPALKPLSKDFMYWEGGMQLVNVDISVPQNYILVGNIVPLTDNDTNSYSAAWGNGYEVYRQLKWQQIPKEQRDKFKKADKSKERVLFAGEEWGISGRNISDEWISFDNALELKVFPCLSYLKCKTWHNGLYEYLRTYPFLTELTLENHGQKNLDFRNAHIHKLSLDMSGIKELYLNDDLEQLVISGEVSKSCKIHSTENGAKLLLTVSNTVPRLCGLEKLGRLHCTQVLEQDILKIWEAYPILTELRLWGKPGTVLNFDKITKFTKLESFTTVDLFGFSADDIPKPEELSNLTCFWMSSLLEDAAKTAKKLYKKRKEEGLNLWIEKPRKPEWLAQNLDNPFRSWDGQENISKTDAKKAADLYRKTRAGVIKFVSNPPNEAAQEVEALVRQYIEGFNKMNKRKSFIETVEREDIYTALAEILNLIPAELKIDKEKMLNIFDELEDF